MKSTFRIISLIIVIATILCVTSCSHISKEKQEESLYQKAIDDFFSALKSKDSNGIKALFSKSAIEADADMQNNIDKLLEIYPSAPTQILFHGLLHGSYKQIDGLYRSVINSTFPIFCDGKYYWIYLELVYEDDFCTENIGISRIEFYTADEYCIYYHSDISCSSSELGFHLFAEQQLENNVICIENCPYEYVYIERDLTFTEVKSFLQSNTSFSDFQKVFGQPNASQPEDNMYFRVVFYEVFVDGADPVYVELGVRNGNEIIYANLLNSTSYLESILEETIE